MVDIVLVGVVLGTCLFWVGMAVFFIGLRKDRSSKFKKVKKNK